MKTIKLNNSELVALVDDNFYDELIKFKWYYSNGYACYGKLDENYKSFERMHRIIIGAKNNEIVDHIDRNKLNNQISNLRIVSSNENAHNRTKKSKTFNKYKGVSFVKRLNLYQSRCRMNGNDYFLGYYSTDIAAAYAYNKKANELSKCILLNNLNDYDLKYLEEIIISQRKTVKKYVGSKYKYISFLPKRGRMKSNKFRIRFSIDNIKYENGNFNSEEEALIFLSDNYSDLLNDIGAIK